MTPWRITIQTDAHGEDVDAAAADDDALLLSYLPVRRLSYLLCEIVFAMTTET